MKTAKIATAVILILSLCLCLMAGCAGGKTGRDETATQANDLLAQIKALNPEAMDSMSAAMSNVKFDYLPHVK